jgi:hypothetical protein
MTHKWAIWNDVQRTQQKRQHRGLLVFSELPGLTSVTTTTNYQKFILHCLKSNSIVKNRNFSWLWCSWSSSGFSSRLVWLHVFFFSLSVSLSIHFVCWLKPRTFWEIKFTHVFLRLGSIPSQLYRHHYALSSIFRLQVYGRRRRRTKWPISTL